MSGCRFLLLWRHRLLRWDRTNCGLCAGPGAGCRSSDYGGGGDDDTLLQPTRGHASPTYMPPTALHGFGHP